ncbi:unnamed protein product [Paramecium octaurelia]|uniref:Transmembrane protein n=1 Tax=Paramecium octaurelia TaxID=43137 RepID=A0A8S1WIB9_PAROT|nr:unnamed protein product [Paramecium octaurelia]
MILASYTTFSMCILGSQTQQRPLRNNVTKIQQVFQTWKDAIYNKIQAQKLYNVLYFHRSSHLSKEHPRRIYNINIVGKLGQVLKQSFHQFSLFLRRIFYYTKCSFIQFKLNCCNKNSKHQLICRTTKVLNLDRKFLKRITVLEANSFNTFCQQSLKWQQSFLFHSSFSLINHINFSGSYDSFSQYTCTNPIKQRLSTILFFLKNNIMIHFILLPFKFQYFRLKTTHRIICSQTKFDFLIMEQFANFLTFLKFFQQEILKKTIILGHILSSKNRNEVIIAKYFGFIHKSFFLYNMKFFYILLGCFITQLNSKCNELQTQPYITCQSFTQNCYILEGDVEDYYELQQVNYQIVEESFQIPYQQEPILIRVINSLNQNKIQEKLICFLLVNLEYYITCMGFDLIFYERQTDYSELIRIDTKILANELCDELYTNEDGSMSLFCLSQSSLKQYSLNFKRDVTLIQEYKVSEQRQDQCKKQQIKWKENYYIIAFYQCSRWKLMVIENNDVETILQAQMVYEGISMSRLSYIDDVTFSEPNDLTSTIYLVENDFYVQFQLNKIETSTLNYQLKQHKNRIQKIVQQRHQIMVLTYQSIKTDSQRLETEIILDQPYPTNNIHFYQNLLFLQNQFELNVLINARINQTYQICNTSLQFFDFTNLFCQFDSTKKVIQFYKYQALSAFIKPKLKYLYVIPKYNLLTRDKVFNCFRMLYDNNTEVQTSQVTALVRIKNNCQNKQSILLDQYAQFLKNSTYNLYSSDSNVKVSIIKNQEFKNDCLSRLQNMYFKDKFQLKEIIKGNILFQDESFFYIYNCEQHKFQVSINLDQYQVLESKSSIYFVNRNNSKVLRGVEFSTDFIQNFKIKFNETITSFQQFQQSIVIFTNSSNLPYIILMPSQQISLENYLSKNLYQPGPILFYFEFGNQRIIQYEKILATQNYENLGFYQFPDSLIISIQTSNIIDRHFIVAIQNSTRSLIVDYLYDQQLHQISNYTFEAYSFYYPFKYKINIQNIAILIEQNNSLYIAIFQYNVSMSSLIEIIQTDDSFFSFDSGSLFYSFNKVWRYSYLKTFFVELEIEKPHQNALSSNFSINLNEGLQLQIQIENRCFELHSVMKSSRIEIFNKKSLKLNISQIFYGPISNLTLLNNSNIILKGPFQFKQALAICIEQTSTICFREYHYNNKSFTVLFKENNMFDVITRYSQNDYYVTWMKQQYYLCTSFLFSQLIIELIECSDNQSGDCKVVSRLDDNFKINYFNIADIIRVGNILRIKDNKNKAFIFIDDIHFNIQMLPDFIIDIQYIEKSNNQYLILQINEDSKDLEFSIYSINFHQKQQIYSFSINQKNYADLIQKGMLVQMKLVSCKYSRDLLNIKLLIVGQSFSQLFLLNLDQQKNQIEFQPQAKFRNSILQNDFEIADFVIQYIDDTILVLKQNENIFFQFYEFENERKFYDYFHKSQFSMQILRLNTTHLIFYDLLQIQLGKIEYELEIQNCDENEYNFQLLAQNEISNEKVSMQIKINQIETNQQLMNSILGVQISCFVFILIYTRKNKSKSRNSNQSSRL